MRGYLFFTLSFGLFASFSCQMTERDSSTKVPSVSYIEGYDEAGIRHMCTFLKAGLKPITPPEPVEFSEKCKESGGLLAHCNLDANDPKETYLCSVISYDSSGRPSYCQIDTSDSVCTLDIKPDLMVFKKACEQAVKGGENGRYIECPNCQGQKLCSLIPDYKGVPFYTETPNKPTNCELPPYVNGDKRCANLTASDVSAFRARCLEKQGEFVQCGPCREWARCTKDVSVIKKI